jgi:hypothetical protein
VKNEKSGFDLAVAYRICPKVSKSFGSLPFSNDKYLLSEICLHSFKQSLGQLRIKMWAVLDGCPPEYEALFKKYFDEERELVIVTMNSVGNRATFGRQIDILVNQQASEFVYFAEDDYLYLPDSFPLLVEFMRAHSDVDFVTPYDHPDCYSLEIHNFPKFLRVFCDHHWRTAASTCLTFLTRREVLRKHEAVFRSYTRRNGDCSLWLSLTKYGLYNPGKVLRYAYRDTMLAKIIAKAWLFCWPQILFGPRRRLWVPVPGIATHLASGLLSPGIDWITLLREQGGRIEAARAGEGTAGSLAGGCR